MTRIRPILVLKSAVAGILYWLIAINSIAAESTKLTAHPVHTINDWLTRIHEASRHQSYSGTFVVTVGTDMASSKIWHVCDGEQQMERIESLTGPAKSTLRHNNKVLTLVPSLKTAHTEDRAALQLFPHLLKSNKHDIAQVYKLRRIASDRVAGLQTDVVEFTAKDSYRYNYRIWTEQQTGLLVKLRTIDLSGQVLEQAAFSELSLNTSADMAQITQMMRDASTTNQTETVKLAKTTANAQGWTFLRGGVPGFAAHECYARQVQPSKSTLQCLFSDGLATISVFLEPFDGTRHAQENSTAFGATHTLSKRLDTWWLTAVGEVPLATLQQFAQLIERKK